MSISILQITHYPIQTPRHGGQIRARHVNRVLKNSGYAVDHIAIFAQDLYPSSRSDIDLPSADNFGPYKKHWQVSDFSGGYALATDTRAYQSLIAAVARRKVDVVIVEEPWLGKAILRLKEERHLKAPVIYSSHNIEFESKRLILEEALIPEAAEIVEDIKNLEHDLALRSAACVAVTEADANILSQWASGPVVVARNGTVRRKSTHLQGVLPAGLDPGMRYMLFVGSGHPPNVAGFLDLVLGTLRKLRSNERIVVAGNVCDPLRHRLQESEIPYLIRDKLILLGQVSEFGLDCLIANASGLLLPIKYGGGANLKTAEALVSEKPVIATKRAFRGFEEFMAAPRVMLADESECFGSAIRAAFDADLGSEVNRPGVDALLWDSCLQPIVKVVASVSAATGIPPM